MRYFGYFLWPNQNLVRHYMKISALTEHKQNQIYVFFAFFKASLVMYTES
jgi:hypothetical protein